MKKRIFKTIALLMCVGIVGTTLSGCSKKEEPKELFPLITKNPEELTLEDLTININGVNVSMFRNVDKTIQSSDNQLAYAEYSSDILDKKGVILLNVNNEVMSGRTEVTGTNLTNGEIKKEEAIITSILIHDIGFVKQEVILPNQLKHGDSKETVVEKCGQPMSVSVRNNSEFYTYKNSVDMYHVYIDIVFKDNKLEGFSYFSNLKEVPTEEVKSFNTEKVTGIKPCIDVSKMEVGPNVDILNNKTITMGIVDLKAGMTFGQFIEDGWEVKKAYSAIQDSVDVYLQRGEDKCVLTMEENYTDETVINKILVTTPFNVDLIPTMPGDVDALEWNAVLTNYGKPSHLDMSKGLQLSYIVDDVKISLSYDEELQLDYYSISFDVDK